MDMKKLILPSRHEVRTDFVIIAESPLTDRTHIRSHRLKEILEFWENSRTGDPPPLWSCFNPMEFSDLLPTISVFSNEGTPDAPDYMLRLEGDISARFFDTPTSMTKVSDIQAYAQNTYLNKHLDDLVRDQKPIYIRRNLGWNNGRSYIEYEILALPFTSKTNGPVDRMLSAKIFHQSEL